MKIKTPKYCPQLIKYLIVLNTENQENIFPELNKTQVYKKNIYVYETIGALRNFDLYTDLGRFDILKLRDLNVHT